MQFGRKRAIFFHEGTQRPESAEKPPDPFGRRKRAPDRNGRHSAGFAVPTEDREEFRTEDGFHVKNGQKALKNKGLRKEKRM